MAMSSAHPPIRKSVLLASVVCFAVQGCGALLWSDVKPVPVEEVDAHGISLDRVQKLGRGDRAESVILVLGEPADRQPSCVPGGEVIWRYPIRAWNDVANRREVVPAVLLRISFDASDTLTDWGFIDSPTGRSLPVLETSDEASRWFQSLSHAPPPIPPRVKLDEILIRGRTTRLDVERILGQWRPDLHCGYGGPVPVVRKMKADSGSVWDWYADRPSPLFVPPRYLVATFDGTGALIVWHFAQTYPGGRK
jgi:hypothetical protein